MNLGPWEILIIAVVVVLVFGARKMPAMARSLGQSMRILKAETKGMRSDEEQNGSASAPPKQAPAPQQLPQAQQPPASQPADQAQAQKNAS